MSQDQQRKRPGTTDRFVDTMKGGAQGQIKAGVTKAPPSVTAPPKSVTNMMGQQAGNAAETQKVVEADVRRDQMLQFIAQRLAQAKVLQARELDQIAKSRVWFDEVAKGKEGFKLPDPTRWRTMARLYEQAVTSLCAGELGRGAQLLDQAIEAEKTVYTSIPAQVQREDWQQAPMGAPDARLGVDYDMTATPSDAGAEMLAMAQEIASVTATVEDAAYPQRQKPHRGWWDRGEDAEEGKDAPKAAAAAVAVAEIAKDTAPETKAKESAKQQEPKGPQKVAAKGPAKGADVDKDAPEKEAEREPAVKAAAEKTADKAGKGAEDSAPAGAKASVPEGAKAQAAQAKDKEKAEATKQEEDNQGRQAVQELAQRAAPKVAKKPAAKPAAKGPGAKG